MISHLIADPSTPNHITSPAKKKNHGRLCHQICQQWFPQPVRPKSYPDLPDTDFPNQNRSKIGLNERIHLAKSSAPPRSSQENRSPNQHQPMKHEQQPRISAAQTGRSARAGTIAARSDATDSKIGPRADDRPRPPTPPPPPTWRQPSPRTRRPPRDPPDRGRTTTGRRRGEEVQACKASYLGERDRAACGGGGEAEEEEGKDGRERERGWCLVSRRRTHTHRPLRPEPRDAVWKTGEEGLGFLKASRCE